MSAATCGTCPGYRFVYRPEVAAKNSDFLSYANGNLASQKLINPKILNQEHLSGRGHAEEAVRHHRERSGHTADYQPPVDEGEDGEVTGTRERARSRLSAS